MKRTFKVLCLILCVCCFVVGCGCTDNDSTPSKDPYKGKYCSECGASASHTVHSYNVNGLEQIYYCDDCWEDLHIVEPEKGMPY